MAGQARPSFLYVAFIASMLLLVLVGLALIVYGSLHHVPPQPSLPGTGLFARVWPHG